MGRTVSWTDTVGGMSMITWAFDVAREKLEALSRRWAHVQGAARQARAIRTLAGPDAELLEAAAILHDVGYAPDLVRVGFHPLDGAVYLTEIGAPPRLVHLVAHHSYAWLEAQQRGLHEEMGKFTDERSLIRDALWYCDQTTSPDGGTVTAHVHGIGKLVLCDRVWRRVRGCLI